jgi:dUTP pyrophosphatase
MSIEIYPIKIKKLLEGAQLPARASQHDAGADLFCIDAFTLVPGERKLIPTGLAIEIPPGYYGRVGPRSGLAVKQGIDTMAGIIDAGYRGHLQVLLINLGHETVNFSAGARIAQLIIERIAVCDFAWAEELSDTARGADGFGSTGQ